MDKILITGATGFLGRACLAALKLRALEMHAVGRTVAALAHSGVHVHPVDLLDAAQTSALLAQVQPAHLLHLAWVTTPGAYWTSADNPRWVEASEHLVRVFAEQGGRRAVLAGSCAEYDWHVGPCHETRTPVRPTTLYGSSKNALRIRLETIARQTRLSIAWGRLFFLYGPHEHPQRLVASVIRSLLDSVPARCSNGTQQRDFLHVQDAADALVALLVSDVQGAVNIASGQATSIRTVVERIAAEIGRPDLIHLDAAPANPSDPPVLVADVTRLREEVGWSARYSLSQGLAHTVAWWRQTAMSKHNDAGARCPVCASCSTQEFLRRASVPVHQHLLHEEAGAARAVDRGDLAMRLCRDCGFGFNAAFDPALLNYGADYDNTQTCSETFSRHVDTLVRDLVETHGVRNCRVVEVGCGKGAFLKKMIAYPESGNVGFGFDPTYLGPETDLGGRVRFYRHFYDRGAAAVPADVVICRHVIEHVPDPLGLLQAVRQALAPAPHARVFFETPCLEWILRHQVLWDFFYEHCSLFTAASLTLAMTRAGFEVVSVQPVFGGQYLWLEGRIGAAGELRPEPPRLGPVWADALSRHEDQRRVAWQAQLRDYQAAGPVALWGAGAKGVTYCNLADPHGELLACVVDVNPAKQGKFVAGTGHRIIAPEELAGQDAATILVLNPNYVAEIAHRLARHGSRAAVIDLMQAG